MTLQMWANEISLLVRTIGPTVIFTTILLVVFFVGRFCGRYGEQRRIRTHLDEITQAELMEADRRIKKLREEKDVLAHKLRDTEDVVVMLETRVKGWLGYVHTS